MSFDAQLESGAGVGVKTFLANSFKTAKTEKIAEFTRDATRGEFANLGTVELALKVAQYRNARVSSDARIYDIDIDSSFYHCLVRASSQCVIHEEPYALIDLDNIRLESDSRRGGHAYFTDGKNSYTFNVAKNTLYKSFKLDQYTNSSPVQIDFIEDIFEQLLAGTEILSLHPNFEQDEELTTPSLPSVVLPLYSSRTGRVEASSGINQWNAGGRAREFGEAYIPIPKDIRKNYPNFFPPKDVPFVLRMPDKSELQVKVCQADGKALMSNPNKSLCDWLFKLIDDSPQVSQSRLREGRPYVDADLQRIGRDSVRISLVDSNKNIYELEPLPLGSYKSFLQGEIDEESD